MRTLVLVAALLSVGTLSLGTTLHAQEPVVGVKDPESLFKDSDAALNRNKQAALHIMRELLQCAQWDRAGEWLTDAYHQHNPNAASGLKGVVAFFTHGEGFHNFHHAFPSDFRNGIRWYHWDPNKWLIQTFRATRLARNLRVTPPPLVENAKLKVAAVGRPPRPRRAGARAHGGNAESLEGGLRAARRAEGGETQGSAPAVRGDAGDPPPDARIQEALPRDAPRVEGRARPVHRASGGPGLLGLFLL